MSDVKNKHVTLDQLIRFDTVDGLYLRENEVDRLRYFLIDTEFTTLVHTIHDELAGTITPTFDTTVNNLIDLGLDGHYAAHNYSKYDHFIEEDDLVNALDEAITHTLANKI